MFCQNFLTIIREFFLKKKLNAFFITSLMKFEKFFQKEIFKEYKFNFN